MEGHVDRQELENAIIRTANRQGEGGVMHPTTIAAIRAAMAEAGFAGAYDALTKSHAALVRVLERCQSMPLLMKTWDKASRDAAYDEIQAALTKARKLGAEGKECGHLRRRSDLMAPPTITCIDCGADLNEGERRELSRLYQKDKEGTS